MNRLRKTDIDYNYFITDWGHDSSKHAAQHTMATNEFNYNCKAGGISFAEWLKKT